jgi:hypothetical protein
MTIKILGQKTNKLFASKAKLNTFVAPKTCLGDFLQGDVAQLVEQRTENPCVGGSIPSVTTSNKE